jgi:hypothetical protein
VGGTTLGVVAYGKAQFKWHVEARSCRWSTVQLNS